ncbi:hypothetical protein [Rhodocista pekingensis]|uniref:Uncharacterized protein n=1 Tax=Rhodocista pekingensis TaxID=201185 RepID=A0ABW2KRQ2_9PROT
MKELRCIVFNDREVVASVIDRRRRLKDPLPEGEITGIRFAMEDGVKTYLDLDGGKQVLTLAEEEVQAALITHCMAKNIPLPVDAEKVLYVIKGHATLMITMNFNRPARLVAMGPIAGLASGSGR